MTWVKLTERRPPSHGWYSVVKFTPGTEVHGFFLPVPPKQEIKYFNWTEKLHLEQTFADRIIYKRCNCFLDKFGMQQKSEEILYWYELDPIPEEVLD